jgi:hypothetical protein
MGVASVISDYAPELPPLLVAQGEASKFLQLGGTPWRGEAEGAERLQVYTYTIDNRWERERLGTTRRKWHTKRRGIKTHGESAIDEKTNDLEPEFVTLLKSPGIDFGPVRQPYLKHGPARIHTECWRDRFLGVDSWAAETFTNSGSKQWKKPTQAAPLSLLASREKIFTAWKSKTWVKENK